MTRISEALFMLPTKKHAPVLTKITNILNPNTEEEFCHLLYSLQIKSYRMYLGTWLLLLVLYPRESSLLLQKTIISSNSLLCNIL